MSLVDVELVEGLALPYVVGAETALSDVDLDPLLAAAWAGLVAVFPTATLQPVFDGLPVEVLADLVDVVRTSGEEPPNPFAWFSVPCDEAEADALVLALQALPLIAFAGRRSTTVLAGVSYGTNPEADGTLQIQEAPNGVSAIYGWNVAGGSGAQVRIADVESGWLLTHQELLTADIRRTPGFGNPNADEIDHGTAVAGVLVGADNGVGTVGITPDASLTLVTVERPDGENVPAAITVAANAVGTGGVVLLELASAFRTPPGADVPVEFDRAVQVATRLATLFGVTVIEPAGNTAVDLDAFPSMAHFQPASPAFVDSRTIMVGAGELDAVPPNAWIRTFSSFGSRVDCFGPGRGVRAPAASAPDAYQNFTGTSSASAVVAGTAAALQGMSIAATGQLLAPTDIRRMFRDPLLSTPTGSPATDRIGSMPDLHKLANALGFLRFLPVGLAATPGDGAVLVHLDDQNRLVRRHWTLFTAWGAPLPAPEFFLTAGQPAVISFEEPGHLVHEAVVLGAGGVHELDWDSLGATSDISIPVAPVSALSQSSSPALARVLGAATVIAGVSPAGHLVVLTGGPVPLVVDGAGQYRRTSGPAIVSRAEATADVVAVEDGGSLRWFTGNLLATIGTGFSAGVSEPSFTSFDPLARPALLVEDDGTLLAAGVSLVGALEVVRIDPAAATVDAAVEVDHPGTVLASSGPVALAHAGANVVALAIDRSGVLRAATRPRAGGAFTAFTPVPADQPLNAAAGVSAVGLDTLGVLAVATGTDGRLRFALSADGALWPPLLPIF